MRGPRPKKIYSAELLYIDKLDKAISEVAAVMYSCAHDCGEDGYGRVMAFIKSSRAYSIKKLTS